MSLARRHFQMLIVCPFVAQIVCPFVAQGSVLKRVFKSSML
jgi:hypothetical protein